jgi:addiction module HigA family antidote
MPAQAMTEHLPERSQAPRAVPFSAASRPAALRGVPIFLPQGFVPPKGLSNRQPLHPGHYLRTRFLDPAGLNQGQLAEQLGISRRRINEVLCGRRAVSADTALRLGLRFNTDPQLWSAWQAAWDLHQAWRALRRGRPSSDN